MESEQVAVEIFELGTIGRKGDEQYSENGDYGSQDVNHSNMRWLGHITRRIGDEHI